MVRRPELVSKWLAHHLQSIKKASKRAEGHSPLRRLVWWPNNPTLFDRPTWTSRVTSRTLPTTAETMVLKNKELLSFITNSLLGKFTRSQLNNSSMKMQFYFSNCKKEMKSSKCTRKDGSLIISPLMINWSRAWISNLLKRMSSSNSSTEAWLNSKRSSEERTFNCLWSAWNNLTIWKHWLLDTSNIPFLLLRD